MLKTIELITHDFGGDVFIDIGGNVGMWTNELYDLYDRILFVEPSSAMDEAKNNIADPAGKVTYFKNICSDKADEKKSIFSTTGGTGNFSVYGKELYGDTLGIKLAEEDIGTITVDTAFAPLVKEGEKVTIKVDTEGADLDILLGSLEFIKKFKPTIVMEAHFHMHYDESKFDTIKSVLDEVGYDITEYKMGYGGPGIVDGKHTGDEMRDLHYQILMIPK